MKLRPPCLQGYLGVNVHSPRNIIFMHKKIEKAFDRQEWCLLTQPNGTLQVRGKGARGLLSFPHVARVHGACMGIKMCTSFACKLIV